MKNKKIIEIILTILVVSLPFLAIFVFQVFTSSGISGFKIFSPRTTDEILWWSEIRSLVDYGRNIGYIGYNGDHAVIGSNGPWPLFTFFPYVLFGKIFGWELYSMSLANVVFLSISLLSFVLLTKPSIKQKLLIIIMYLCLPLTIGYSMSSMSEGVRYSLGIVLLGIIFFCKNNKVGKIGKLLIWTFVVYAVVTYIPYALMVPFLCIELFKEKSIKKKVVYTIISTVLLVFLSKLANTFLDAAYPNTFRTFFQNLLSSFIPFVTQLARLFITNLRTFDIVATILNSPQNDIHYAFTILYMILLLVLVYKVCKEIFVNKKDIRYLYNEKYYIFLSTYMLVIYLFSFCLFYSAAYGVMTRGVNAILMMSLFSLAFDCTDHTIKVIYIMSTLLCTFTITDYYRKDILEQVDNTAKIQNNLNKIDNYINVIDVDENRDYYENTIAIYGGLRYPHLLLPSGSAFNFMTDNSISDDIKYACYETKDRTKYEDILIKSGVYKLIYSDGLLTLYVNTKYE